VGELDGDEESRTERSGKLVRQAWESGDVPIGHDAQLVLSLAAGAAALVVLGNTIRGGLVRTVVEALEAVGDRPSQLLPRVSLRPVVATVLVCGATAAGMAIATLAQTRGHVWGHRVVPDLSRLAGSSPLRRLFTKELLLQLAIALVKVLALSWAAWTSVHGDFLTLAGWLGLSPMDQLSRTYAILLRLGTRMLVVGVVLAGADVALQQYRFMKRTLVTKQDAKRESREEDGDPKIKGKRRARHREISKNRARVEVPRADALVVNPTHIAIALRYRRDEGRAPRVLAKGKGELAEYMRALARENAIPIVQDIALARLLYRKVKVGREIPVSTYKAVAAVLAFVYRVTGRAPGGRAA